MRATVLALLLATGSTHALAAWELSESKKAIIQNSVDHTAYIMLSCGGTLSLFRRSPALNMRWRIDSNDTWFNQTEIQPTPVVLEDDVFPWYQHNFFTSRDLLSQLILGADLRVHWGDTDYDRFSLVGFTRAFDQLECIKKTDQEYFL